MRSFTVAASLLVIAFAAPAASADIQGQACNHPLAGTCMTPTAAGACDVTHVGTIWLGACLDLDRVDITVCSSVVLPAGQMCFRVL